PPWPRPTRIVSIAANLLRCPAVLLWALRQVEDRWGQHLPRRNHDEVVADTGLVQPDPSLLRSLANTRQWVEGTVFERRHVDRQLRVTDPVLVPLEARTQVGRD